MAPVTLQRSFLSIIISRSIGDTNARASSRSPRLDLMRRAIFSKRFIKHAAARILPLGLYSPVPATIRPVPCYRYVAFEAPKRLRRVIGILAAGRRSIMDGVFIFSPSRAYPQND